AGVVSSNTKLYHNSISLTGDRGAVAAQIGSYGVAISGSNPTVELKNNIFYNTQTASSGGVNAKSYAIGTASTTFTNMDSNFNDFFTSGANASGFRTASLDTTGTDFATLAAWQGATSKDANSFAVDPLYVSPTTDLHLQMTSPMINAGTNVGVTTDIDGQTRDSMPDIGADEFIVIAPGTVQFSAPTYSVAENVAGGLATITVTRTGGASGAASVQYATADGTAHGGAMCANGVDYVNASGAHDGSQGFAIAASDGVVRCIITNGTIIPGRGHFLCANNTASTGYSLGTYPAGNDGVNPTNATPDATYTTDIPDNAGIALFNSTTTFTLANRLDAVGSPSEANTTYKEGTGYPALSPSSINYSFYRDMNNATGTPKDTDNNATDFILADTNGTGGLGPPQL